jgi:hypothetical protein
MKTLKDKMNNLKLSQEIKISPPFYLPLLLSHNEFKE